MKLWAVVPVKALSSSKKRLASALGARREEFARALVVQTLSALAGARRIEGILVVTADQEVVEEAHRAGAMVLQEDAGLNTACARGIVSVRERGADVCAIFHADLPLLSPGAVDALIWQYLERRRALGSSIVGLVRCHEGTGTNAALFDPHLPFTPAFGPHSFAAHQTGVGSRALELSLPEIAFDVDAIADLESLGRRAIPARLRPFVGAIERETDPLALLEKPLEALISEASQLRDEGHGEFISFSPKVFLPLTHLCRDSCHYCAFARAPRQVDRPFMTVEQAVETAVRGRQYGCKEALFTLGERPELRYSIAKGWLAEGGFATTLEYLSQVAGAVRDATGLLPHINAGSMTAEEIAMLRPVCASMGLMLESVADRLCAKGGPHYGSPDKSSAVRLATIAEAGRQKVPFTTGILIGIGETRAERIDSLLAIRRLHERYGHIQEVIIQNFLPKAGTRMAKAAAPSPQELVWTIAIARILLGRHMNIQAPPNLNPGVLDQLIAAGINDWGGVSPLTPDYVNPEAPWPEIESLKHRTAASGKVLVERMTIYPVYAQEPHQWLDLAMHRHVLELSDGGGLGREDSWLAGRSQMVPLGYGSRARPRSPDLQMHRPGSLVGRPVRIFELIQNILGDGAAGLGETEVAHLFRAREADFDVVCEAANALRERAVGNLATYVVNRNINYTNLCTYACSFCAFSKGKRKREGAEEPYLLDLEEIGARVREAWSRGATEVCLQGGIHPTFTGRTYLEILRTVKRAVPAMHVHAFSPLEVWHGARTLGLSVYDFLRHLKEEGLGSLPGTAAEILDDSVRQVICPDKLDTRQWLSVIEAAHAVGLQTTATIMFGHVDDYRAWARHLLAIRDLQMKTGGFTEFVPLPFVAHEAPLYKLGRCRPGPTFREAVLMHAVARLVLHPHIKHVQTSWVKMGINGMRVALESGADDMGGTLMNESITRAAGAIHGQEMTVDEMRSLANSLGRSLIRRTTLYEAVASECEQYDRGARGLVAGARGRSE